eukprot:2561083-Pleurochrysis_carterae.AAC.1
MHCGYSLSGHPVKIERIGAYDLAGLQVRCGTAPGRQCTIRQSAHAARLSATAGAAAQPHSRTPAHPSSGRAQP